ncbi:choline/ethanolamine kinase family protein [Oceanicoccus sagamiensis]|uniref:Aminoglycoside phosphotransferase domain-containing protein n=1 Tax=Oceanicoccus sagamiensis TaxID=716816 RepID=A0A1X9NFS0_9GAMM|nr:choline/ethanolamine kinase family protein [Oceanicoccus sagamiensis]ARN74349.1 hypothetical protein BST96_09565 [Oceanicoccus sagamiensis]
MSELTASINLPGAPEIDKVLQDWRSWCNHQPTLERPLHGGLTNKTYLVESLGQRYVVRINAANSRALDLRRDIESRALMFAADAGIGAELVYFDPYECYLVTRYLDAKPWTVTESQAPEGIQLLASLLKTIHRLESVDYLLDINVKANNYWKTIPADSEMANAIEPLKVSIQHHIDLARKKNKQPVLCHNDLMAGNLMQSKEQALYALDWEYAAMGDPYFDLAVVVQGHNLNESESLQLLEYYLDANPDKQALSRLYSNRVIYCYLSVLWYAVKYHSADDKVTLENCQQELDALRQLLA